MAGNRAEKKFSWSRLFWSVGGILILCAAIAIAALVFFGHKDAGSGQSSAEHQKSAVQLEALYDGKDPRGINGTNSKCADPPPSQPVFSSQPTLFGPDGRPVGIVELRTSPTCPVIWARVIWNGNPNATYKIPSGWTLHIIVDRPETKTSSDSPVASSPSPIQYGISNMLVTVRGCVFAEVYFSNGHQRTYAPQTSCVKH